MSFGLFALVKSQDMFSSMDDMEKLHKHETVIEAKLEEHLKQIDADIAMLDTYFNTYYPVSYKNFYVAVHLSIPQAKFSTE